MKEYIAFDSHKHYTLVEHLFPESGRARQVRINHAPGVFVNYLKTQDLKPGTPVAVEATGNWYWIINEIETAGGEPRLVHPRKAKLMMGHINKTDKLDVHGLNRLQQNRTLPTVWIAPKPIRDLRELTRARLFLTAHRARLKNRLQSILAKYALAIQGCSDPFGRAAMEQWKQLLPKLPEHTQWSAQQLLDQLFLLQKQIQDHENRLKQLLQVTSAMERLKSLPGIGVILAATVVMEIGDIGRFATHEHLASYSGTTPRVYASGGKMRFGRLRPDVNRYLKWAFVEAANSVALHHLRRPDRHVSQLYKRLKSRKGHSKAIGAVARHLAEATFHVLSKDEDYLDPKAPKANGSDQSGVSANAA